MLPNRKSFQMDFYERVLDSLPIFIGVVDSDERYEFVNGMYEARYGMKKEDIIGSTVEELNGSQEYQKAKARIDSALQGDTVEFEYQFGDQRYLIKYIPRKDGTQVTGYFVVSTNITGLKNGHLEIAGSNDELEVIRTNFESYASFVRSDRIKSIGAMATSLAEEINHPISSINVLLDSLKTTIKGSFVEKTAGQIVDDINQRVHYAADIINRIRKFATDQNEQRVPANVDNLIYESLSMLRPRLTQLDVTIQSSLECSQYSVLAVPLEIQQVIINLIGNAIESFESEYSSKQNTIQIESRFLSDSFVSVWIADNGPGVEPELRSSIFDPFESDKVSAGGMGLAISRALIERNGGTLELDEIYESGTAFEFLLPVFEP